MKKATSALYNASPVWLQVDYPVTHRYSEGVKLQLLPQHSVLGSCLQNMLT